MDAQRALLDSLMGLNRDGDRPDDAAMDFRHPRVCKPYLCGLCPRDLFQNTRLDAGACALLHLPALRAAYQEQAKRDFGYERALANELAALVADVEKKIARGQRRLAEDGDAQDRTQVLQLTQDLQDAAAQAEQAAQAGDAARSLQLLDASELLKRKRRELLRQNAAASGAPDVNQKLRVCDVCGAFLSIFDSDKRLADHFGGKVHVGYVQIRQKLQELTDSSEQKEKGQRRRSPSRSRSRKREEKPRSRRESSREERERRRERSRSRQRHRERDRRSHRRRRSDSSSRSRSGSRDRRRRRRH